MSNLKKALESVKEGYSPKDLFKLKLRGDPVDLLRKTIAKELGEWLIEHKIFARHRMIDGYNCKYEYVCKYPARIWHVNGRGGNEQIMVDHLKPGDIWTF